MKLDPRVPVVAGLALTLVLANALVLHKESVLARGRTVLVELAPVDPRSLMQGDYMRLDYALTRWRTTPVRDGKMVVKLDEHQVAHFERFGDDPRESDEAVLQFKTRQGRPRIGANAYFFEEGHAEDFATAKYGELRVTGNGQSVLVGLRDRDFNVLRASEKIERD